jgi:hypothetical protein
MAADGGVVTAGGKAGAGSRASRIDDQGSFWGLSTLGSRPSIFDPSGGFGFGFSAGFAGVLAGGDTR